MAWLENFNNRLKLTIPADSADSSLTNFPVMINLSSSSGKTGFDATAVFDELDDDHQKRFAITKNDGTTQCPVEIEYWDATEEKAVLWTKIPTVYSSVDTDVFFYYDVTTSGNTVYVGDIGDSAAQSVWDSNFKLVMHMAQDPNGDVADAIKDSTSNTNHGTPDGAMTSADLVDGKIGKAIDFDGTDDFINCGDTVKTLLGTSYTVECTAKTDTINENNMFLGYRSTTDSNPILFQLDHNNADARLLIRDDAGNVATASKASALTISDYFYIVGIRNGADLNVYVNADVGTSDSDTFGAITVNSLNIAAITPGTAQSLDTVFNGILGEVRISNTARSAAWIKATYYSNWDDFIVFRQEDITTSWLSDWSKRIKLTIDKDKIDSTLIDFPINVTLDSDTGITNTDVTDVFTTISGGSKKIAITTNDGLTQCYVEIERWDEGNEQANLWTKVPVVDSNEDTILYLYYDSSKSDNTTYIGDTGDSAAQNVWDANFVGVWHLSEDPSGGSGAIKDSTQNVNNGTLTNTYGTTNIALSKTCTLWPSPNSPSNVVDGNVGTRGFTNTPNVAAYFKIDLGAEYLIGKIRLLKNISDRPNYYYIQTADDYAFTVNVQTIITATNEASTNKYYNDSDFGLVNTRYLRVLAHTNSQYIDFYEFEVYELFSGDLIDGKIGKAVDFYGASVGCGSNAVLDDISKITIEAIFKADGWGEGNAGRIISKSNVSDDDGWNFYIYGNGNNDLGFVQGWGTTNGVWYTPNSSIALDNWYYVAVQYDRAYSTSDKPTLYINSVSKTVSTTQTPVGTIESDAAESVLIGTRKAAAGYDRGFDGIIDEVRISKNIHRSLGWVKATYYSNWDELVSFGSEQEMPTHYYYGYITEDDIPISRTVRLYHRDTGILISNTTSNADTGYYYLTTTISGEHFIVTLDDEAGKDYNALILDKLLPRGIE